MRAKFFITGLVAVLTLSGCALTDTMDMSPKGEMTRSQTVEFCNSIENKSDPRCSSNHQAPAPGL